MSRVAGVFTGGDGKGKSGWGSDFEVSVGLVELESLRKSCDSAHYSFRYGVYRVE